MRKAVATKHAFRRSVNKWAGLMGLTHPWRFSVDVRDGDAPAHGEDEDVYACCEPSPNYYYAKLTVDPYHIGWHIKEDGEIDDCMRHELFHALLSPLTMYAQSLARGNKDIERALTDLEEQVTTALETMPVWETIE